MGQKGEEGGQGGKMGMKGEHKVGAGWGQKGGGGVLQGASGGGLVAGSGWAGGVGGTTRPGFSSCLMLAFSKKARSALKNNLRRLNRAFSKPQIWTWICSQPGKGTTAGHLHNSSTINSNENCTCWLASQYDFRVELIGLHREAVVIQIMEASNE